MITVTLTTEEIRERSQALAQYANKLIELEEEEEDVKAGHKSRMARLKERRLEISGEIRRLSRAVRLGVEERSEQRVLFEEEKKQEEFRQQQQAEAEQASREAVEEFFAENEELQSVLSLVFEDPIALEVINGWTIEQKEQAMKWATAAHLQASDNDIDVPPVPEFLKTSQEAPDAERERLHREAVATWRRERPASSESEAEEGEEESEANPQINEHGVYVKGVEVIKVPFPKKARKTEVVIALVKDDVDGMWRSAYSATAGVASFTGPISDYDPCHETREGAIAAAGWKARSFLLRQVDTGGLSEAAKRQVEAAIPALDDWLEINARDHSADYPDNEIEAEADDVRMPQLFVPKLEDALENALLHHVENAAKRWEPLRKNGATDAELTARISDEFKDEGGSSTNGGWKVKGGKSPQFTWKSDGSTLKGKRLLAKVRGVMGIGSPGQSNDPNTDHSAVYPNDEIEAADEDDGGTPFPTEYPQAEIERMAESCAVWEIDNEKPVKICYILDQPHVITGREPSKDAENWVSVSAWQILPLENVGEENARTIGEANAEYDKQFDEPENDYKPLSYKGVKINCGSKKKPAWWVIVGSEQRFTVSYSADYPDDEIEAATDSDGAVEAEEEPTLEAALSASLHSFSGARDRWKRLQVCGTTDAELTEAISYEFGEGEGTNGSAFGGWIATGGKSPEFAWPRDTGRVRLKGKRLLAKVREMMEIGAPGQTDDFTAPRCDECGRIDGAHIRECSKSNALRFEDYLAYAEFAKPEHPKSWARKWELSREMDGPVMAWKLYLEGNAKSGVKLSPDICKCGHGHAYHRKELHGHCQGAFNEQEECDCVKFLPAVSMQQQAGNGVEPEAKPKKKKRAKLSPVEATIDR